MQTRIVEIPLNKLVPSEANVRKTNRMLGVEELAANIAARGGQIIQSLSVRPVRNETGEETGVYRVPAGGRRLAALKLLAKRKVIAKTAPIPCIVSDEDEEELSLSENVMREPLHPADQFEAFKGLADKGQGAEEIGARFGVTAQVVRQRLRLAAVSPVLFQIYRDGGLTLDQLMAFTVSEDHARQEQVHDLLASNRAPYLIRRTLTETQVQAQDRRAIFVGAEAYVAAGGTIIRDLFTDDGGGWFSDPALLDRLTADRLDALAADLKAQGGWKWAEAHVQYPHAHGLRRLYPSARDLTAEDQARLDTLSTEYDSLAAECDGLDELPEEVSQKLDALSAEIDSLTAKTSAFEPEDIARAGAFVVLGHDGAVRIECGFVRPEDEPSEEPTEIEPQAQPEEASTQPEEPDGEGAAKPISDGLVRELMAHRTMALRCVLGEQPDTALIAVVHALALRTFYQAAGMTCLDLAPKCAGLGSYAAGIDDTAAARGVAERHVAWATRLPEDPALLWSFVEELGQIGCLQLLAHCASLTVFAVREVWDRSARVSLAADTLAHATDLDMTAYWRPTAASYFGRVPKAFILAAVQDAVSDDAARRIAGLKKTEMAEAAEALVADKAWLPLQLRTPPTEALSEGACAA